MSPHWGFMMLTLICSRKVENFVVLYAESELGGGSSNFFFWQLSDRPWWAPSRYAT